jgi:hypothetical protein
VTRTTGCLDLAMLDATAATEYRLERGFSPCRPPPSSRTAVRSPVARAQDEGRAQRTACGGRISRQQATSSSPRCGAGEPARWGAGTSGSDGGSCCSVELCCRPPHPLPSAASPTRGSAELGARDSVGRGAGELRPGAARASSAQAHAGGKWPITR